MICSDFGAQKINSDTVSTVFPSICYKMTGLDGMILVFWVLSFKPTFSLSSFTFIKRLFSFSSLSAMRVVSSAYLRLLIFLLAILIPACASSSPTFHLIYSINQYYRSVMSNSLWIHGLHSPQNSPGQNTGVGRHSLLEGIFPTQELNPGLPHCKQILYQLSYQEASDVLCI